MSESTLTKFLFLGVGIFVSLITISAVISYYTTAREAIKSSLESNNIDISYNANIDNILVKEEIEGWELKNVLQYYEGDILVDIKIDKYYAYDNESNDLNSIKLVNLPESGINRINKESYDEIMKNMLPNQRYTLTKENEKLYVFRLII